MMPLFPQPHTYHARNESLLLGELGKPRCHVVIHDSAEPLEREAAELLAEAIAANIGARPAVGEITGDGIAICVGKSAEAFAPDVDGLDVPDTPEAYVLHASGKRIVLIGNGPPGTFYAAQTLKQMMLLRDGRLTVEGVTIADWPDLRYRGLYVESKWGPDLMGLDDWRDLVDYMAALKFNSLGIGVYCCWGVQYEGKRTEFLMVPFPKYPELETPKTIRYYSANEGEWKALTYLPKMFEEDFLGEVVAYAKRKNITVRPHFNGPGHTTLIPHTHPEVSSKDDAGRPTGYGYCLSNPRTYELLFELWDSIIDRYLLPNGVDWFHAGLDEIYPITGVDEKDPDRKTDPWCKCPACRELSQEALLTDYVIKVTQHLVGKGINNITLWNDHLSRRGMLTPEFVDALETAGVKDKIILQWWRYDEPVLEIPEGLGLRAWTTPMPGYYAWLFTRSYTSNIYPHLHLAYRAGAEGADAYCIFDPAFDRNYVCLANYAWNQTNSGDLYQFKSRYAEKTMGASGFEAVEPFEKWDQVYDSMPLLPGVLDSLLYYWHTYSWARNEYPRNVVKALLRDDMRALNTCRRARTHLARAQLFFATRRDKAPKPELIDEYLFECSRLVAVVDVYDAILAGIGHIQNGLAETDSTQMGTSLEGATDTFAAGLRALDDMMAMAEKVKKPFLLPQLLRDLSQLRAYVADLSAATVDASNAGRSLETIQEMMAEVL